MEYTTPKGHIVILDDDVILPGKLSIGSHGYVQLTGVRTGSQVLLHRWLLGLVVGDGLLGDHINGNPLDCRRENLRIVDASGSAQNTSRRSASGLRNVYCQRGRWYASVNIGGVVYKRWAESKEEAHELAKALRAEYLPYAVER